MKYKVTYPLKGQFNQTSKCLSLKIISVFCVRVWRYFPLRYFNSNII